MKLNLLLALFTLMACELGTSAQGTFLYDQQSSDESRILEGGFSIPDGNPMGQSFTPRLNFVGFIRIRVSDGDALDTQGATLIINLRQDSMTGPILGTTSSIQFPDRFISIADFLFSDTVAVIPGNVYYFQPEVVAGGRTIVNGAVGYNYPGGSVYFQGASIESRDLWFREGIVVPEPGTVALLLGGLGGLFYLRRMRP